MDQLELGANDLDVLALLTDRSAADLRSMLDDRPWLVHEVLTEPAVADAVLGEESRTDVIVSPFLLFAVLGCRAADELRRATHVNEWSGRSMRLPVFDVAPLQEFGRDPARLLFLAGVLASFVAPDPTPVPVVTFDVAELAMWLDAVDPADRPLLLERLGDLALFVTGVYPDRTASVPLDEESTHRLARTLGMEAAEVLELVDEASVSPRLDVIEGLGPRWYGAAAAERRVPPVMLDVAHRFGAARRFLTHLADRYLHPFEPVWDLGR